MSHMRENVMDNDENAKEWELLVLYMTGQKEK